MDLRERLGMLSEAAVFDDAVAVDGAPEAPGLGDAAPSYEQKSDARGFFAPARDGAVAHRNVLPCVSHHTAPDGQRHAVLKILQTSACENDCNYCAFRAGRNTRRAHVTPDELARSFDLMYRAGLVEGMFLSSGVMGTTRTMDEMLATVELARNKYGFVGYIHLKVLPNAQEAHVERAVKLADRVSVNLEGPTQERLDALAPRKRLEELMTPLREAARLRRKLIESGVLLRRAERGQHPAAPRSGPQWGNTRLGLSTQFVVGPAGESDRELLTVVNSLYQDLGLSRAYYSAFTPVKRTPLEYAGPTDPAREHRLYQADWLLRFYGFSASELPYDAANQLRTDVDPKSAWARAHPEYFPIEVNRAPLSMLLRIPGIGPQSARAIVETRRIAPLREIGDLKRLGAAESNPRRRA
jgi:predicted DNA-binding helix-hairpin-helix protein